MTAFRIKSSLIVLSCLCLAAPGVNAALVAGWDMDPLTGGSNNFGPSPFAPTQTASNVSVSGLTRGSGIGTTGTGAGNAWGGNDFSSPGATFATALAANELISFTVKPDAGFTLSLESIGAHNVRRSGTGPSTGQWQYAINAGTWSDIGTPITFGAVTTAAGNSQSAISLTSITALQNVSDTTTVSFRAVLWGATSSGGTWYLNDPSGSAGNDFSITGTVAAIPEPTAFVFGGLAVGAVGLTYVARRRRAGSSEEAAA